MWDVIKEFFAEGSLANYILDGYLVFIVVFFIAWFALKSKHIFSLLLPLILAVLFCFLANQFDLKISKGIYNYICAALPIMIVVVMGPDIHSWLDSAWKKGQKTKYVKGSDDNKQAIADAVMYLSSRKIGALITIEKHKLLDQYAEKAVLLNSEISKELLINI